MMMKTETRENETELKAATESIVAYAPSTDIIEGEKEIVLISDMPGADEKSLEIMLEKDRLSIAAKSEPEIIGDMKLILNEYGIGDYRRVFSIGDGVDREGIKASIRNGALKITFPKITVKDGAKKIKILTE